MRDWDCEENAKLKRNQEKIKISSYLVKGFNKALKRGSWRIKRMIARMVNGHARKTYRQKIWTNDADNTKGFSIGIIIDDGR